MISTSRHFKRHLLSCALAIGLSAVYLPAHADCDVSDSVAAGKQKAVQNAYDQVAANRKAVAGTANDGYGQAETQRQSNQTCMFNASDTMGNIVKSGGDLGGLVNQLTNLLSSSSSGCAANMTSLSQQAEQQAKAYAQQQASQLQNDINTQVNQQVSQQVSQQVGQALTSAPIVVTPALPVTSGLPGAASQLSQQQIQQAWSSLSKYLSSGSGQP